MTPLQKQTLALAGVAQAAHQVHRIATGGEVNASAVQTLIDSLFVFEPPSTEAVFGGVHGVDDGLRVLGDVLGGRNTAPFEAVMRYLISMIQIANQLKREPAMLNTIHDRLEHIDRHRQHFSESGDQRIQAIAGLYQDTISTLRFRVRVNGQADLLKHQGNAERIRTLLLAGIRSAWLWQQLGGRRWHWLFLRQRVLDASMQLLRQSD